MHLKMTDKEFEDRLEETWSMVCAKSFYSCLINLKMIDFCFLCVPFCNLIALLGWIFTNVRNEREKNLFG